MAWLQLSVALAGADPQPLETTLEEAGALAITLRDAGDQPLLEPGVGETPLWRDVTLTALFDVDIDVAALNALTASIAGDATGRHWERIEDRDWEREWLTRFKPQRFGERLWVLPGDDAPPDPEAAIVRLDPGLAFGTGDHPTTAMCLEWLAGQDLGRARVLDFGCGSGILAVAALKLGATAVVAVDNDPQALIATRANAQRNGVASGLDVVAAGLFAAGEFDVVIANILAEPLVALAPTLCACLGRRGRIALSGLLGAQAQAVMDAYAGTVNWRLASRRGDWALIAGMRSEAS